MPRFPFTLLLALIAGLWMGTQIPGPHTPIVIDATRTTVVAAPPAPPEPAPVPRLATIGQVKIVTLNWSGSFYYARDGANEAGRLIEQGWSVLAVRGDYGSASIALQSPALKP